jgi:hypothetical protein
MSEPVSPYDTEPIDDSAFVGLDLLVERITDGPEIYQGYGEQHADYLGEDPFTDRIEP